MDGDSSLGCSGSWLIRAPQQLWQFRSELSRDNVTLCSTMPHPPAWASRGDPQDIHLLQANSARKLSTNQLWVWELLGIPRFREQDNVIVLREGIKDGPADTNQKS